MDLMEKVILVTYLIIMVASLYVGWVGWSIYSRWKQLRSEHYGTLNKRLVEVALTPEEVVALNEALAKQEQEAFDQSPLGILQGFFAASGEGPSTGVDQGPAGEVGPIDANAATPAAAAAAASPNATVAPNAQSPAPANNARSPPSPAPAPRAGGDSLVE